MNKEIKYVLIEGKEHVIPIGFLEEEIYSLLEEDFKTEIKGLPSYRK